MNRDELIPPLHEPEPENAPGAFYVMKDTCIICGAPPNAAPRCVSYNMPEGGCGTKHCRVHMQPETTEELKAMIEAMSVSCVEAIRYRGTDPSILAELERQGMGHLCDARVR